MTQNQSPQEEWTEERVKALDPDFYNENENKALPAQIAKRWNNTTPQSWEDVVQGRKDEEEARLESAKKWANEISQGNR